MSLVHVIKYGGNGPSEKFVPSTLANTHLIFKKRPSLIINDNMLISAITSRNFFVYGSKMNAKWHALMF